MLSIPGRSPTDSYEDQHFAEDSQVAVHCQRQLARFLEPANAGPTAGQFVEFNTPACLDRNLRNQQIGHEDWDLHGCEASRQRRCLIGLNVRMAFLRIEVIRAGTLLEVSDKEVAKAAE